MKMQSLYSKTFEGGENVQITQKSIVQSKEDHNPVMLFEKFDDDLLNLMT